MQVKVRKSLQAMRGSALRYRGWAAIPPAPRGLAGVVPPRAPRPKGVALPCGNPAPDRFGSGTPDPRVRPLGNRARKALLSETSAPEGSFPLAVPSEGEDGCMPMLAVRLAEIPEWRGVETPFPLRARPRLRYRSFA
jgi:hypothetical protein